MKIIIYNENVMQNLPAHKKAYANGLHNELKSIFEKEHEVTCVTLADIETGLSKEELDKTDVLIWWGHIAHDKVPDAINEYVCKRVSEGMGAVFLHSAHFSKPFTTLCGTPCSLRWREANEAERVWTTDPFHPIAQGVEQGFRLDHEEMYGEHFYIPTPDSVVFTGWFEGGEVFRSGCCFHKDNGRFFYFQPGHETFPIYKNENVRLILKNAVHWVAKVGPEKSDFVGNEKCLHPIKPPEKFKRNRFLYKEIENKE